MGYLLNLAEVSFVYINDAVKDKLESVEVMISLSGYKMESLLPQHITLRSNSKFFSIELHHGRMYVLNETSTYSSIRKVEKFYSFWSMIKRLYKVL